GPGELGRVGQEQRGARARRAAGATARAAHGRDAGGGAAEGRQDAGGHRHHPTLAAIAPATPWKRRPMMIETLTMFGPGRNCESDSTSRNSSSLSQRRRSTIMRRAKGKTPPKPESPILRKPTKSAEALTETTAGVAVDSL